jgi:two-component system chemotaxis sensor kinase CheA
LTEPDVVFWDVVLLMATLVALAWLFEKAKDKMRDALAANNRELQLVLDSVGQGFLSCDVSGTVVGRHSAIAERWFGSAAKGQKVWAYVCGSDERFADRFRFAWSAIVDDVLPIELCLDQLPKRFAREAQVFQLEYQPVKSGGAVSQIVIVITDVTAVVESERKEAAQRELAAALDCALSDPAGFLQFMEEAESLVSQLDASNPAVKHALHTLKGNCGFFGAHAVAAASHALEDRIGEGPIAQGDVDALKALWRNFSEPLSLIIDRRAGVTEVTHEDFDALREAVRRNADHAVLDRMVTELRYEPVELALRRSAVQACALAERLDKGEIGIVVRAPDVRLDPRRWKPLWSAFDHAIRNAVDHGLETPDERLERGKPLAGQLRLSADLVGEELVITLEDDGRGVDWERVRERARARGVAHETAADLENALFLDGLTTRDRATSVSGRGIGLSALREQVRALGGTVEVRSRTGEGTTCCMRFPAACRWSLPPRDGETARAA